MGLPVWAGPLLSRDRLRKKEEGIMGVAGARGEPRLTSGSRQIAKGGGGQGGSVARLRVGPTGWAGPLYWRGRISTKDDGFMG